VLVLVTGLIGIIRLDKVHLVSLVQYIHVADSGGSISVVDSQDSTVDFHHRDYGNLQVSASQEQGCSIHNHDCIPNGLK
jgi:hypothetical protein